MRRILLALVPVLLLACERQPVAPDAAVAPAFAATHTTSNSFDFFFTATEYLPCAAESVYVAGNIHYLVRQTLTPSGHYSFAWLGQPQGLKGIGRTSGTIYKFAGFTNETIQIQADSFPMTDHFEDRFFIIGPGPSNNAYWFEKTLVVLKGPGDYVVQIEESKFECK